VAQLTYFTVEADFAVISVPTLSFLSGERLAPMPLRCAVSRGWGAPALCRPGHPRGIAARKADGIEVRSNARPTA
jgi:hypothetical protein